MMAVKDIEKIIRQKKEEIQRLKEKLLRAEVYLEAMQDSLRLIKKAPRIDQNDNIIRPGSMVHKARTALRKAGKPLHVNILLRTMKKEVNKKNKLSLAGSLGGYIRQKSIFTRPAPNTFGLIEFEQSHDDHPPEGFGGEND